MVVFFLPKAFREKILLESRSSRSQKMFLLSAKIFFFVSQISSRFLHALCFRFHCWVRNNEKSIFEPGKIFLPGRICPRTLASRPTAPWDPAPSPAAVYRVPAAQRTRKIRYRIISEYAGTYRSRLSPLITCAVGAYSQREAPAPGTHGRVFAGCGRSVRGYILPVGVAFMHVRTCVCARGVIFHILHLATCHVWQSHMPGYGLQC